MNSNWVRKPLGEVVSLQRGYDLPMQKRVSGSVPIMGSAGITGWHNEAKMKAPGVIVGRSGNSMGEVHYCDSDYWPLNTCLFVTNFKGNDEKFIYLLLQSVNFKQFNSGSAQQSLNRNAVYPYEVTLPKSKEDQSKIADVIFDITDKIRLNNQTNQTLEAIAQAIFKSWFVDFEPVKAKMSAIEAGEDAEGVIRAAMSAISGKTDEELDQLQAENPECYIQLKTTAELFPAAMQDSELGEIPEGWKVRKLGDIADEKRKNVKIEDINPETPYFGLEHIPRKSISLSEWGNASEISSNKLIFERGDILFGKIRPYFHKVGVAPIDGVCSTDIIVISPEENYYSFVLSIVSSEKFVEYATQTSEGTKMPRANWKTLVRYPVIIPDKLTSKRYNEITLAFVDIIQKNIFECKNLSQIRDTLLPKLLSGELSVDAAEFAEE